MYPKSFSSRENHSRMLKDNILSILKIKKSPKFGVAVPNDEDSYLEIERNLNFIFACYHVNEIVCAKLIIFFKQSIITLNLLIFQEQSGNL